MKTTTIKLTQEEAERIATALNYMTVEYYQKKMNENPDSKFWKEEWWKNIQLQCRLINAKQRIAKKGEQ